MTPPCVAVPRDRRASAPPRPPRRPAAPPPLEEAERDQVVLHLLEGAAGRSAVDGDRGIVGGAACSFAGAPLARVEERLRERGAERPDPARAGRRGPPGPLPASRRSRRGRGREERRRRDADLRVRGGHAPLGGRDVGTPLEELRRKDERHSGGPASSGRRGIEKSAGGLADEDGDRVLELRARDPEVGRLGARRLELGLGLGDVDARDDPLPVPVRRQLERRLVVRDGRRRGAACWASMPWRRNQSAASCAWIASLTASSCGRRSPARPRRPPRGCGGCGRRGRAPTSGLNETW